MTSKPTLISKLTNRFGGLVTDQGSSRQYLNVFVDDTFTEVPKDQVTSVRAHIDSVRKAEADSKKLAIVKGREEVPLQLQPQLPLKSLSVSSTSSQLPIQPQVNPVTSVKTYKKSKLDIDSRHRDAIAYPNVSDFYIYTPKSFNNVVEIQLLSLEMPNVDSAINPSNNALYWINEEDVDIGFPVYTTVVKTGSYSTDTLKAEMNSILHSVNIKRRGGTGVPHYFIVDINRETSFVNFTSIIPTQTGTNPFRTIAGSGVITVTQMGHGYKTGETIYIIGAIGRIGGVDSANVNGAQFITVLSPDSYKFEIP